MLQNKSHMAVKYSLFVNGKSLGPFERRMIVGMRVKDVVKDDQIVLRDDGVELTVAQLMMDRLEATPTARPEFAASSSFSASVLGAPSSGMWPDFAVRFGGGPMNPGALGFNGNGTVSYQGDALRFRGNRRNAGLGMSRQEESLPVKAISTSMVDGCVVELFLIRGLSFSESIEGTPVRLEHVSEREASELWELLNMAAGDLPHALSYAKTAAGDLN